MTGIRSKLRVPVMAIQTTYSNEKREREVDDQGAQRRRISKC